MLRTNTKRFVALLATCLVVAFVAAGARGVTTPNCTTSGVVKVCVSPNNVATFTFSTKTKTTASVSTGVDFTYPETVMDLRAKTAHTINIPEAPATKFNFKVTVTPIKGKPATWKGSFTTNPYDSSSTPLNIAAKGSKITLNGQPFFVIANKSSACPSDPMFQFDVNAGINTEEGALSNCLDSSAPDGQGFATLHGVLNGQVGWRDTGTTPSTGLPERMNWGSGIRVTIYPFFKQSVCGTQRNLTESLYQLVAQYASKGEAVIYSRSVGNLANGPQTCLTSDRFTNIFWTIPEAKGAGIEESYEIDQGNSTAQTLQASIQSASKKSADQMKSLEAAFGSGKDISVKTTGCTSVHPRFVTYGGVIYGIAVNNDDAPVKCAFTLPKNAGPMAQRLWESGSAKLKAGTFSDSFTNLGVHLYKVMPAIKK